MNKRIKNQGNVIPGEQRKVILLDGESPEDVGNATRLGSMFITNGQGTKEIRIRINHARSALSRRQSCLWSRREVSVRTKGSVYQAVMRSILVYGCKTWQVR